MQIANITNLFKCTAGGVLITWLIDKAESRRDTFNPQYDMIQSRIKFMENVKMVKSKVNFHRFVLPPSTSLAIVISIPSNWISFGNLPLKLNTNK